MIASGDDTLARNSRGFGWLMLVDFKSNCTSGK
jgi:hypothetical protein